MEQGLTAIEVLLRIALGLRFLSSGLSNLRRWPNPIKNTRLVFSFGETFFAFVAVTLMVLGGMGLALGWMTEIAALMVVVFLIPTFKIHRYWLRVLPKTVERVRSSAAGTNVQDDLQLLAKQAVHSHEVGLQDNLILLIVALFFAWRGSVAFGLDNLFR